MQNVLQNYEPTAASRHDEAATAEKEEDFSEHNYGEKITFDYLLQKVVENTATLTNPPTLEASFDDEPELPVYKVTVGDEEKVTIHKELSKESREEQTPAALVDDQDRFEKLFSTQRGSAPDDFALDSSSNSDDKMDDIAFGFDFNRTGREDDVIKAKEAELLCKAKELENEMMQVRQAKVNSVLRQFEQQLQRDARLEHQRLKENLEEQYT